MRIIVRQHEMLGPEIVDSSYGRTVRSQGYGAQGISRKHFFNEGNLIFVKMCI
jgi:hypothetical protein